MSDNVEDLMESMKRNDTWLRVVFMIAFSGLLYIIIAPVIFVLMLAQFAFVLAGGKVNQNLSEFSSALIQYVASILQFVTYETEDKPFPFSDFPQAEVKEGSSPGSEAEHSPDSQTSEPQEPAKKEKAAADSKPRAATKKKADAKKKTAAKVSVSAKSTATKAKSTSKATKADDGSKKDEAGKE